MTVDMRPLKSVKVSLPVQTSQYIREMIETGQYQPGQQLPPESDFARQLGISRPTLREALHSLEQDGVLVCRHGVGTFISPAYGKRLESGLEVLESIERIANRIGLKTSMGDSTIEEREALPFEMKELGLDTPTRVLFVSRSINVDGKPVAYLKDVLPINFLCEDDLNGSFHGSIIDVLLKRGQPALAFSMTKIAAVTADPNLAALLGITAHTPLMRLEARLFSQNDEVVDYSISHFVPGYFEFHVVRRIEP